MNSVESKEAEKLAANLVFWIKEQALAAGCKGLVLGMSGGIDSSVLAVLCKEAMPENILGLIMSCYSNPEDEQHACLVADKFHIPVKTISLDDAFNLLVKTFSASSPPRHAAANLKARLRMLTLYYHANSLNYLVVGSGNKDELSVGYFTKYGDGGIDILPLGDMVKSQVRDLGRYLGVPQTIIDKPPSAGLWAGQTDENEMGLTYNDLDRYLVNGLAEPDIKKRIEYLASCSDHKRRSPPIARF